MDVIILWRKRLFFPLTIKYFLVVFLAIFLGECLSGGEQLWDGKVAVLPPPARLGHDRPREEAAVRQLFEQYWSGRCGGEANSRIVLEGVQR